VKLCIVYNPFLNVEWSWDQFYWVVTQLLRYFKVNWSVIRLQHSKFWLSNTQAMKLEILTKNKVHRTKDHIGGVMVSVFVSSAVVHGFEPRSGQIKDYKIGICCFSTKKAALRSKSKDWFARNQDNVSELSNMYTCTCRLLFQWASITKIQLSILV
jgi:hypothetical protein